MAEFIMECPSCKMPVLARTGLFAKKKVKCDGCGYMVIVEKMAEEPCPKCGNTVAYDRTKTSTPQCPSCNYVINVSARLSERLFGANTVDLSEMMRTEAKDTGDDCADEETGDVEVYNVTDAELEPVDLDDNSEDVKDPKE